MANESLEHAQLSSPNTNNEASLTIECSDNGQPANSVPVNLDSSNAQQENITVTKLQELIDVCKEILAASVQIADVEKHQSPIEPVSQSEEAQEDRERRIWAAIEPQEIETIEVMTPEELEANPFWEEKMLAKAERLCPDIFHSWKDIWGDYFALKNPEQNLWLQKRLMVLCCSIDEDYDRSGWIDLDSMSDDIREVYQHQRNEWEASFKVTIGHVLKECYRRRILAQPDADTKELYFGHIEWVISVALTLNITWWCRQRPLFCQRKSVECLMGLPVAKIVQLHRFQCSHWPSDSAEGSTFSAFDLKISLLKSIGNLKIEWTDRHERHLLLNRARKTLEICWFSAPVGDIGSAVSKWFGKSFVQPLLGGNEDGINSFTSALEGELIRTWALLFSSSNSRRGRRKAYASLPEPRWFMKYKTMSQWLNQEDMNKYTEMRSHLNDFPDSVRKGIYTDDYTHIIQSALRKQPLEYSSFPIYESRLRELRAYMDSSKPPGLRQLFRDNRDSLTYYTFWGVIVFGTLSVALALFSLGISAAQAVAGFRALQPVH
ncbi:stretch-activated cation channel mid1 [Xylographa trunciseda]|nr:stretch-activated cation channel mid1 [Xylographa trunciseda]